MDQIPEWICNDFFTQCLQNEEGKQNIVVTNFKTSPAVPPGNNYGSIILRVKVEYKHDKDDDALHSLNLILKSELTEGLLMEMFDVNEFKEPIFYNTFLPEAMKLTKLSLAPKSYFSPKFTAIVLEDLTEQGYVMIDKVKQLDFDHCCLYAIAAATLHAVSFAVHKKNPELVESIGEEKLFSNEVKGSKAFKNMIAGGFKCLADSTEKIDRFKRYCKLIADTSVTLWDMLVEAHKPSEVINTINQGDPWTANMMFKYDDKGIVREIKLLDFQALRYGSPVNDLIFFVWSSANHDVRRYRLDEVYHVYLDTFNKKLEEYNCTERLTYEHFMDNVQKLNPLAVFIVGTMCPLFLDPNVVDVGQFFQPGSNENFYDKYYNEHFCNNHLLKLLEQLEFTGVFDYLEKYYKCSPNMEEVCMKT